MQNHARSTPGVLRLYYWATLVFVLLDYAFGINVRLAFLENWPGWRALYYLALLGCLALMLWRPSFSTLIGTVESLLTLTALILSMGVRVYSTTELVLTTGQGFITMPEIVNFMLAGFVAYFSWWRGMRQVQKEFRL